jgi:predicted Zn finger-like uncharacterized protein
MSIVIRCPRCGTHYRILEKYAGKRVRCKACGEAIAVPAPADAAEPLPEVSPSGQPIWRHGPRTKQFTPAFGDEATIHAIDEHITRHLGPVAGVFHELVSDLVHIDIHMVAPTDARPYHTLVTSGMSDRPMTVPTGAEEFRYAELMLCLPPEWPLTEEAFQDEVNYWPIRWLKILARFPHEYETWLGYGHTVPNGDPPEPYAPNTKLCCALLLTPSLAPKEFAQLRVSAAKTIHFYALVPLYLAEMEFKLKHGVEALAERLCANDVTELLDVKRVNVCKGSRW